VKRTTYTRRAGGKLSRPNALRPGSRGNTRAVKHGLATSDFRRWFRETKAAIEARLLEADAQVDVLDLRQLGEELRADARRLLVLIGLLEARALETAGDDAALSELADRLGRLARSLSRVRATQITLSLRSAGLPDGPAALPDDVEALRARLIKILEGEHETQEG